MPFLTSRTGSRPVAVTLCRHLHPTTAPRVVGANPLQCGAWAPLLRSNPATQVHLAVSTPPYTLSIGARHAVPFFPPKRNGRPKVRRPLRPFSNFPFPFSSPLSLDANAATTNMPPAGDDSASDIPDTHNASPPGTADTPGPHDHPNCDNRDDASHIPAHPPTAPPSSAARSSPSIPSKSVPRQREPHTSQPSLPKTGGSFSHIRSKIRTNQVAATMPPPPLSVPTVHSGYPSEKSLNS